jgi:hypothetical protein
VKLIIHERKEHVFCLVYLYRNGTLLYSPSEEIRLRLRLRLQLRLRLRLREISLLMDPRLMAGEWANDYNMPVGHADYEAS